MEVLIQKNIFSTNEFKLTDSKLICKVSDITGTDEFGIAYEDILGEKTLVKTSNIGLLVVSISIYIVTLIVIAAEFKDANTTPAILFWLILPTIMMLGYRKSRIEKWKLPLADGRIIELKKNVPDSATVLRFLEKLIQRRNKYLQQEYIGDYYSYESQFHNLQWLKLIGALSANEFNAYYAELRRRDPGVKTIDFDEY